MCGSLRHEDTAGKLGKTFPIKDDINSYKGYWNGHAREETLTKWTDLGWKEGKMVGITSYTEGRDALQQEYPVPSGKAIKIIYNPKILTKNGEHPFQIVTREATTEEAQVHPRFPRLINDNS